MAKGIIDEIKSAEEKASEIIVEAHEKAAKIIEEAKLKAEKNSQESKKSAETKASSMIATAENNAFKVKSKAFEDNKTEADALMQASIANLPGAVDLIIKEIIPE